MPKTYEVADKDIHDLSKMLIEQHHPHLLKPKKVTVQVVMVHGPVDAHGEPMGPALKHGGYPAAGVAKIINPHDRAMGMADAEIQLDAGVWAKLDDRKRMALMDHELTHFELKRDGEGNPTQDDGGRPELRMVLHDYNFGWFTSIAERYGVDSYEVQQATKIATESGQMYFPEMLVGGKV